MRYECSRVSVIHGTGIRDALFQPHRLSRSRTRSRGNGRAGAARRTAARASEREASARLRVILFVGPRAPSHVVRASMTAMSARRGLGRGRGVLERLRGIRDLALARDASERRGAARARGVYAPGWRGHPARGLAGFPFTLATRQSTRVAVCGAVARCHVAPFAFERSLRSPYLQVHDTFIEAEAGLTAKRVERARHVEPGEPRSERSRNARGARKREQAEQAVSVRANERRARPISLFQSASRYNGARGRV